MHGANKFSEYRYSFTYQKTLLYIKIKIKDQKQIHKFKLISQYI